MSIIFTPQGGDVLCCDFGPDPRDQGTYPLAAGPVGTAPEMIKRRHAAVISTNHDLVVVAPFSTVVPSQPRLYHHRIASGTYPFFDAHSDSWLKADALMSVSRTRLDRLFFDGRYRRAALSADDFQRVRQCVLHAIGLGALTRRP